MFPNQHARQDVCAIRAMGRLRYDSNGKGWLFTILRNIWLNGLSQRTRTPELVDVEAAERTSNLIDESAKNPYDVYVGNLDRRHVRKAIHRLPDEAREVILHREWKDPSYQEIATDLDCPVGTVMSRLVRARSKLRDLLSSLLQSSYPHSARTEATQ